MTDIPLPDPSSDLTGLQPAPGAVVTGPAASRARLLAPLTIPGRNALAGYVLPILIKVWILLDWQVTWTGKSQSVAASLLSLSRDALGVVGGGWTYTLAYILAVWLGLAWMARRGLIWKF